MPAKLALVSMLGAVLGVVWWFRRAEWDLLVLDSKGEEHLVHSGYRTLIGAYRVIDHYTKVFGDADRSAFVVRRKT